CSCSRWCCSWSRIGRSCDRARRCPWRPDVERTSVRALDYASLAPGRHELRFAVATLADGSELAIPVTVLVGRRRRPRLVAIAGVHGNEFPGPLALVDLARRLDPAELDGTVVI